MGWMTDSLNAVTDQVIAGMLAGYPLSWVKTLTVGQVNALNGATPALFIYVPQDGVVEEWAAAQGIISSRFTVAIALLMQANMEKTAGTLYSPDRVRYPYGTSGGTNGLLNGLELLADFIDSKYDTLKQQNVKIQDISPAIIEVGPINDAGMIEGQVKFTFRGRFAKGSR